MGGNEGYAETIRENCGEGGQLEHAGKNVITRQRRCCCHGQNGNRMRQKRKRIFGATYAFLIQ